MRRPKRRTARLKLEPEVNIFNPDFKLILINSEVRPKETMVLRLWKTLNGRSEDLRFKSQLVSSFLYLSRFQTYPKLWISKTQVRFDPQPLVIHRYP